jgi:hypothetical protein
MPTQFSTEAANADVMGEDAQTPGKPEGMPHAVGADGTPRDPPEGAAEREARGGAKADERESAEPNAGEAKPGKDINAPGFVKDKDAGKP